MKEGGREGRRKGGSKGEREGGRKGGRDGGRSLKAQASQGVVDGPLFFLIRTVNVYTTVFEGHLKAYSI